MGVIETLKNKVVVSCQAMPNEPLYREECMLAMMKSVLNGGAGGLRCWCKRCYECKKDNKCACNRLNKTR